MGILFLRGSRQRVADELLNHRSGFRRDDTALLLALLIEDQRGNQLDAKFLHHGLFVIHIDFGHKNLVAILLRDAVIGVGDLAAVGAPWRPEIHQHRAVAPEGFVVHLSVHIHS